MISQVLRDVRTRDMFSDAHDMVRQASRFGTLFPDIYLLGTFIPPAANLILTHCVMLTDIANGTPCMSCELNESDFEQMLVGPVAANVLTAIDPSDGKAMGVLLTGYFFQGSTSSPPNLSRHPDANLSSPGLGFFMTFFYLCIYVMKQVRCTTIGARSN